MEAIYINDYIKQSDNKEGDIIINENIKYKLDKLLGKGYFGMVFKSITSIGRKIAMKIIDKQKLIEKNYQLEFIKNEIEIHSQLRNINIINFEKMFQDNTYIYMILELSELSFYDIIYENKEFISEKDAIKIVCNIINGLMYLKENLIIHRDIKPENILINNNGDVKIADFGLAIKLNNIDETINETFGTIYYISYQMVKSLPYSFDTDMWSLGVLFYELLFKKLPFDTLKSIRITNPTYPKDGNPILINIINRMFIKDRLERISLEDVIIELGCE